MLPSERHAIILEEVSRQPAVSIRSLTERLGVSRETVRKDIEQLAQENKLNQVRGGATSVRTHEPPMADRTQTNREGKERIGAYVASTIPDGASVIIDNGSTTLAAAHALAAARRDLVIYTNDLTIASILEPAAATVTLLGGRLDFSENATMGLDTLDHLSRYNAEYALIGVGGISARALFTYFSLEGANLRNMMIERSQRPFLLADSSKFNVVGQVAMKPLSMDVTLVVDSELPKGISETLRNQPVKVVRA
ncbi:DeoR/GlpR transcriptional regulator [Rhodobacteraceae bacterium B1Z28]|uniref:DeoR/GlpR transcriptional regulator n=1 Tax=Ruegeria haliotis TaxID=2747601 RepID=A0ABX2PR85_9RHOB|nr:DeoR/GlpR family DNA-binding transcription regulator [Ruegeria haliotis]NVO56633.1 DeoR/GlpR transcriptional regulator [Ruegeria haliotis]